MKCDTCHIELLQGKDGFIYAIKDEYKNQGINPFDENNVDKIKYTYCFDCGIPRDGQ
jgi:hypothetical protein